MVNPSVTAEGLIIKGGEVDSDGNAFTELCLVELKPSTAYELVLDAQSSEDWEAVVVEEGTGLWIGHTSFRGGDRVRELFRTFGEKRARIFVRALTYQSADSLVLSRISIREIREL
jgi:hypothetical protein